MNILHRRHPRGTREHPRACIHELFAAQARRTPAAEAVVSGDGRLTYRELNRRANRLARCLRQMGVGPEVPVGLCLERSAAMIVGVLGVLKAGGAYVPLDPTYPRERLAFMLEAAAAPVLLAQEQAASALPRHRAQVVLLGPGGFTHLGPAVTGPGDDVDPPSGTVSDNLAYIIFTSGSTGRPKGTLLTHRGLPSLALGQARPYGVGPRTRTLQFASLSFDASVFEMFLTLCGGGALVLARPDEVKDPQALSDLLARERVTFTVMPPSVIAALPPDAGPALEVLAAAGEACPAPLAATWARRLRFVNAYGPTEATVSSTAFPVPVGVDEARPLPIGRPLPDVSIHILDVRLEPVPAGKAGEICIGGAGLARGYLDRPDLTAERFIPDPGSRIPGARLYRTGDRGRRLPGGDIEFLGRVDDQVKVRGFRIEPGEVEAALHRHPRVRQAVVVAREDGGNRRLVAYVVPAAAPARAPAAAASAADLREFLSQRLPAFMIPSAFVTLDALPLTPSGKVDKGALPAPDLARLGLSTEYVAPRTPAEQVLAELLAELLALDHVGVEDDFFELGGHSLLAMQVISRIHETLGVDLPLRAAFEVRTVAALAAAVEMAGQAGGGRDAPPIRPVSRTGPLPLSSAQKRLWFYDQFEPDSPLYNLPFVIRLSGALDGGALGAALNGVVRRHEALRTTFVDAGGEPGQVIHEHVDMPLPVVDLGGLPGGGREAEAARLVEDEARQPFDLRTGPLLRATLLRLGQKEHLLLLNVHHIVFDGWSMGVFFRELAAGYTALAAGRPSKLPALPIQYADFAQWQRQWLSGATLDELADYWREKLSALPVLDLPTDRARPPAQTFCGATATFSVPADVSFRLKELGRRCGATPFMTLVAAFKALLCRCSGQEDVVVGSVIANRDMGAIEGLIGFFVNTLVLRTDLAGDPAFDELLRRVRDVTLEAYAHRDMPFDQLVELLQPARDPSRSPLFQVLFVLQSAHSAATELPSLIMTGTEVDTGTAKFDLTVQMWEAGDSLTGSIEYNTDLYDAATIERMIGHFQTLLAGAVAAPDQRLSGLPLLAPEERHRLLCEWNATATDYLRGACIHELFAARAQEHPGAVALSFQGQPMTYRELHHRSDQLAHYLRRLGVGHETLVGICVERSPEMVVGMLGVLKAGGAYVPLDPAYPRERLAFVLDDVKAPVLLTQERLLPGLPACGARVVCLDAGWDEIAAADALGTGGAAGVGGGGADGPGGPGRGATARSLAYVIHTSGSTGRPKGTLLTHRGVVSMVSTAAALYGVTPQSRMLQFASPCFDASVWECFMALAVGATLVLAPAENLRDPRGLCEVLAAEAVTVALLPPSMLSQLPLDAGPALQTLLVGGEACPAPLAAAWARRVQLVNAYGPTEATVIATTWPVPREVDDSRPLPIGRPVPNAQAFILDKNLQPVPVGVAGELHVGGDGLARGYLNRRELTREKFIRHPFNKRRGARLYKTGDLARYRPDGNIEFLGRVDQQVKIRGFRVELGEIEANLAAHPAVREAAVVAREDRPGGKSLYAYVVAAAGEAPAAEKLRAFLKEKLPDYMVPSGFITLDALPLLPSGKVDRRALPAPDQGRPDLEVEFVAPRTPAEEVLAGLWADVLGVERVGIHDDFFELGGHSLLATQLVSRVRDAFRVELPLRALFAEPTVAGLAASVELAGSGAAAAPAPPITPAPRDGDPPLSYAQQRLWFLDQLEPGSVAYNIPLALRVVGDLDVAALEQGLGEVVRRHEALRATFSAVDGRPVQDIAPAAAVALPVVDLCGVGAAGREAEAQRLAGEEARRPFDLVRGPLWRATLLRLGAADHVLLLTLHHIVADGWSMSVLFRELAALYEAFRAGGPSSLPEPPIQYVDFARWQRQQLSGPALEAHLEYWRQKLGPSPAVPELPGDLPPPAGPPLLGAEAAIRLPPDLSGALKALSRREGLTLFMTLLAALAVLLGRLTGEADVTVGTPIAGRNRAEIEGLAGFFVNTLALRADLGGNPTFRELLRRVREVALEAYAHQDAPFEKLVELLQPDRRLDRTPLFNVFLNLTNMPQFDLKLPGLRFSPFPGARPQAKFPMTFYVDDDEAGLEVKLVYQDALFSAARAQCVLDQWAYLLEQVAAAPDQRIGDLSLLAPSSRAALPDPEAPLPEPAYPSLPDMFRSWAGRAPDLPAVSSEGRTWSYGELAARAGELAGILAGGGLGRGDVVAVRGARSFGLIAAMLAVLDAGGVLLALDRRLPPQRQRLMTEQARAGVVLQVGAPAGDDAWLWERFAPGAVVLVDPGTGRPAPPPAAARGPAAPQQVGPDDPAYIFFTSGTSGVPAGVLGCHKGLSHFLAWQRETFGFGPRDRCAQLTGLSFDVVLRDIFTPLASGATLCLPGELVELDAPRLIQWLQDEAITSLHTVPSLARSWLYDLAPGTSVVSLRQAFFAGEPLTDDLVRCWRRVFPAAEVFNLYGPTETTLAKCWHRVAGDSPLGIQPVGFSLPGAQALVLSAAGRMCGVGERGEIVVRTPFRTLGYVNAPEGLRRRFCANPFRPGDDRDLVYYTGDAGRFRPDGALEILGRLDQQVKIRGVRVEPDEVAAVLAQHPAVRSCAVLARQDGSGQASLAAYVVPAGPDAGPGAGPGAPPAGELRAYLAARLPAVMVPSAFVPLAALPLTPNGKLDRAALPDPASVRPRPGDDFLAPRTAVEEVLAGIWAEVLGVERVGVHDNFFELGGHSLLATGLVSRMRRVLRAELPLRALFEAPTLAGMAAAILADPAGRARVEKTAELVLRVVDAADEGGGGEDGGAVTRHGVGGGGG